MRWTMIVLGMVAMVTCATAQVPMVMFQWSIDLEQGIISMTFSRDVDLDSVNFDGISLQNPEVRRSNAFSLSCGELHGGDSELWIRMCMTDRAALAGMAPLATSARSAYISLASGTVSDADGNGNIETDGMAVSVFIAGSAIFEIGSSGDGPSSGSSGGGLPNPWSTPGPVESCVAHSDCSASQYCDGLYNCWDCADCAAYLDAFDCLCPEACAGADNDAEFPGAPESCNGNHDDCQRIDAEGNDGYCDILGQCWDCESCAYWDDSFDGTCPSHCTGGQSSTGTDATDATDDICTTHEECGEAYCSSTEGCSHCVWCHAEGDSVTGACPEHCFAVTGDGDDDPQCDAHSDCAGAHYCDENRECWPCYYCFEGYAGFNGQCGDQCDSCAVNYAPTIAPSTGPTTSAPTTEPTASPSAAPTSSGPTASPSAAPTTSEPTASPSAAPTTSGPTASPSAAPTTSEPTTSEPTTSEPTPAPSSAPTTSGPTASPTPAPTVHRCLDGSHGCDSTIHGICEQLVAGGHRCGCEPTHHCSDGNCTSAGHTCEWTTSAPTPAPSAAPTTPEPTTSEPTPAPSAAPTTTAPTTPAPSSAAFDDITEAPCPRNCGQADSGGGTCRPTGRCLSCNANRLKINGRCVTTVSCKGGRIQTGSMTGGNCRCVQAECHFCTRVVSGDTCRVCRDGWYLLDDACVAACPTQLAASGISQFKRRCAEPFTCQSGRLLVDPAVNYGCKCAAEGNTAIADCQICEHRAGEYGQHCLKCNAGMFLHENRCDRADCDGLTGLIEYAPGAYGRECRAPFTCTDRTDAAGNACKCDRTVGRNDCLVCEYNLDGVTCQRCTNSKYLRNGNCVDECREDETAIGESRDGRECS